MKKLNYWILMLLACVSVGFLSACSEDDDEPTGSGSSGSGTSIVGTWYDEDGDKIVLSKNGTYEVVIEGALIARGTFAISGNRAVLKDADGSQYEYTIVKLTKDELCVEDEEGDRLCYYRNIVDDGDDEEDPGSEVSISGNWYDENDGDKLVLSKDGTFELFDLGVVSFIRGTYTISGNRMVFTNEDGGQYKYTIVKQTKDELWLENENGDRQCWCRDIDNDGSDEDDDAGSSGSEVSIIGIWYGYSENETMRYVFSETGAFSVYDDDELTVSGTYTISGDHIIVEAKHGDRYRITIGKLSETELVLLDEVGGEMEHLYRDY